MLCHLVALNTSHASPSFVPDGRRKAGTSVGGWKLRFRVFASRLLRLGVVALSSSGSAIHAGDGHRTATTAVKSNAAQKVDWAPVVSGRLPNGVRYAILRRQGDEPGIGLLMRNEGGFIEEQQPGERGLTHLIEHLVFVSPTLNAPNDLHYLPKIGLPLTFPAPSAGTTSWRETNYFVSTRTTRTADLDTLLRLFREVATDLTFRSDAVDDQRADVMREMADRKPGNVIYADYIADVAPGSPTDVIDGQNSDDVPTASVETIRALYRRLYRPENMMVVIVGNVDPTTAKALITQRFGSWKSIGSPVVHVPVPRLRYDRIAPISFSALPQGRRTALITVAMPTLSSRGPKRSQMNAELMDRLAIRAVNNRLARAQPGSPSGKVGMFIENGEQGHRLIMLWDNFTGDAWQPALVDLKRTTCGLGTAGFSADEWDRARRDLIQELEQITGDMGHAKNVELAKDLSHAIAADRELIAPSALLRRARIWLPTIDVSTGSAWWRRQWQSGHEHVRVEAPELARVVAPRQAIRTALDAASSGAACRPLRH